MKILNFLRKKTWQKSQAYELKATYEFMDSNFFPLDRAKYTLD